MTFWHPATARELAVIRSEGYLSLDEVFLTSDRDEAADEARRRSAADPQGPSLALVLPIPATHSGLVAADELRPEPADQGEIAFDYVNWRGERATRRAAGPYSIRYGTSDWHAEPQYLLRAVDLERGQPREYAIADMTPLT